jgi:hypothetical protein
MYVDARHDPRNLVPIAEATDSEVKDDLAYHRKIYRLFVKFFFASAVGSAVVLGALFLLIYR